MMAEHGNGLVARQHVNVAADEFEDLANLSNGHPQFPENQYVLEAAHVGGKIGAEAAVAGRGQEFGALIGADGLGVGLGELRQFSDEQKPVLWLETGGSGGGAGILSV